MIGLLALMVGSSRSSWTQTSPLDILRTESMTVEHLSLPRCFETKACAGSNDDGYFAAQVDVQGHWNYFGLAPFGIGDVSYASKKGRLLSTVAF